MFKITPNPTFTTDAELHVPGEELPGKIKVTFKYLNPDQLKAWQVKHGRNSVVEALQEVITAWDGVEDDAGNQVPFSADNLNKLMTNYQTAGADLTNAFLRELLGARRKN